MCSSDLQVRSNVERMGAEVPEAAWAEVARLEAAAGRREAPDAAR